MNTTVLTQPDALTGAARWRVVLSIFKLRIGVLITLTALAGVAAAQGPSPTAWKLAVLALAVLVSSAAAGAFNQYVEAQSDRLMRRTRNRAFASGALKTGPLWMSVIVVLLAAAVGTTWAVVNGTSALFLFLGAFTYAVIYTVGLKRRTWMNIVFGGLSGSFAVLTGAAAVDPTIGVMPMLLALVLFLWTPPHFWSLAIANREDYVNAGVPMLPVVVGAQRAGRIVHANAIVLVAASLLPVYFGAGPVYGVAAMMGGTWFLLKTAELARDAQRPQAMAAFFASMVQLAVLIIGVVVDAALR